MLVSTSTRYLVKKYGVIDGVKMYIDAGYAALDFSMTDTALPLYGDGYKELAAELVALANESGVIFNQSHAPFIGKTEVYENEYLPLMPRAFEFSSLLGIRNVVVHPRKCGRHYGNEDELFKKNVEMYTSLKPFAKKFGVRIAIENMWQRHPVTGRICDDVCAPPEELARIYDTLDDPEVFTVCLDTGHAALCGREPEDMIRYLGKRISCLHVHDVDYKDDLHTLPGAGKINWAGVCRALADIDYDGDLTLEANNFHLGFLPEMEAAVTKFMADTAKSLAAKIEFYKKQK